MKKTKILYATLIGLLSFPALADVSVRLRNSNNFVVEKRDTSENLLTIIESTGNVGIGTTAPATAKLEVNGQIKMTGGTPGIDKVLTSDTDGLASWQKPKITAGNFAYAYSNAASNVLSGSITPLKDLVQAGTDYTLDAATSEITVSNAGKYLISVSIHLNDTNVTCLSMECGGTTTNIIPSSNRTNRVALHGAGICTLNANDKIALKPSGCDNNVQSIGVSLTKIE